MVKAKVLTLADMVLNICIRNILKSYQSGDKGRGEKVSNFAKVTGEVIQSTSRP